MSFFRIYIHLKFPIFLKSLFTNYSSDIKLVENNFKKTTKKNHSIILSQLRVGFILILKYLKKKNPKKNEIIISSYNLAEMVNICRNFNLKIIYPKLNENIFLHDEDLKKKINNRTLAVVVTNIFNNSHELIKIKNICRKKKVILIEDNAIYYGNYFLNKGKKIFSGSFGDYSLHSFNIMKNISAMYGGLVSTNNNDFIKYVKKEIANFSNFSFLKYAHQIIVYLVLKLFSFNLFYRFIFFYLIKLAHKNNNNFILQAIYPSLKFKKENNYRKYLKKAHPFTVKLLKFQIKDKKNFIKNFKIRKDNNIYYSKLFNKYKINNVKTINLKQPTFQNFNDFPIIIKNKKKLQDFLFKKGIETKKIQYIDCHKIFSNKKNAKFLQNYEDKVLCLPNHIKISKKYIEYIVSNIKSFYLNKN